MFLCWEWYMVTLTFLKNAAFLEGSERALGKERCHTVFFISNAKCCFIWTELWPLLLPGDFSHSLFLVPLFIPAIHFSVWRERWHLCLCKLFRLVLYISLSVLQVCLAHDLFLKVSCSIYQGNNNLEWCFWAFRCRWFNKSFNKACVVGANHGI